MEMFGFDRPDNIMTPNTHPDHHLVDVFDSEYLAQHHCGIGFVENFDADNVCMENVLIGFPAPQTLEKYLTHMYGREMKRHPLALYSRS